MTQRNDRYSLVGAVGSVLAGRFCFIGIMFVLNLASFQSNDCQAQWSHSPDTLYRLPFWRGSRICPDGSGGVWAIGSIGQGIGVDHLDRYGNMTWPQDIVIAFPGFEQEWLYESEAVMADNGDLIFVTHVQLGPEDTIRLYMQRINLERELLWGDRGILLSYAYHSYIVGIYRGPVADTYLIYWYWWNDERRTTEPRLQLINGRGEFLWGNEGIALTEGQYYSKIVITEDHGVIVAQNCAPFPSIEILKFDRDGDCLWDSRLGVQPNDLTYKYLSDIESDRNGGAILLYEYGRRDTVGNEVNWQRGINALRLSGEGDSLWTLHIDDRYVARDVGCSPILNYAGSGRYFAAWGDFHNCFQVVGFNSDGEFLWEAPKDITVVPRAARDVVGVDSDDGVIYAWVNAEDRDTLDGYTFQLWGQRINSDGERLWGDQGLSVQARYPQRNATVSDGAGGAITLVDDNNRGTLQMINRNGEIGVALPLSVDDRNRKGNLFPSNLNLNVYPNPFNSSATINYFLPTPGSYAIDVIDIQGRLVKRFSDGWREVGSYREVLNGGALPTGEYLIQLNGDKFTEHRGVTLLK